MEASTTFASDREFNVDSQLAIARKDVQPLTSGREAFGLVVKFGTDGLVQGGLSKTQVLSSLSKVRPEIRVCYENALASRSTLEGSVRLRWTIDSSGSVNDVKVKDTKIAFPKLLSCVSDVVKELKFPASRNKRPTVVEYGFNFRRGTSGQF